MSRHAKFTPEVIESALELLKSAKTLREFRDAQAVVLPALLGLSREQTATALGLSSSHVSSIQNLARHPHKRPGGTHGGRRRQTMTIEQERDFLLPWTQKASTAGMVIVPPLHAALEDHLGREIHHSQVYRMLARHGWRKLAPDSVHPKTDADGQEDWKKNFRKWWPPSSAALKIKEKKRA